MSWKTRQWICVLAGVLVGGPALAGNLLVPPSGDTSGATDPDNIEAAWYSAGPNDLVVLSDGDPSTVDHYYVNRVMIASSYGTKDYPGIDHASLVGESEQTTILEAVHNDEAQDWVLPPHTAHYIPECPAGYPAYANCNLNGVVQDMAWGTPLWGDYLSEWTMRNLTLRLSDPIDLVSWDDPRAQIPRCHDLLQDTSDPDTADPDDTNDTNDTDEPPPVCEREFQAMAFWGGNGDYEFSHVTIEVMSGTTARVYGPHIMWGTMSGKHDGHGNLTIKDCTLKNAWWGPIIMQSKGGHVTVSDLKTIDVGNPVDFEQMSNDKNTVSDSTFEYTGDRGFPMRDWDGAAVQLRGTLNATIQNNVIVAPAKDLWSGVFLFYDDHDITVRDNVFTDVAGDPDPLTGKPVGAVYVPWAYWDYKNHPNWGLAPRNTDVTIMNNQYGPDSYGPDGIAIHLNADDSTINEPSLVPSQVFKDGTNDNVMLGN